MLYIILISIILNIFFVYYCIKFALIIIKMQEVLEESLDKIDSKYQRISDILEIPLFFDSPEIRRLLLEIKDIKNIILEISLKLTSFNKDKKIDIDSEEENSLKD